MDSVFAAVDTGGAGGLTVQGVTFAASSPNLTISTAFPVPQPGYTPFGSTTANDASLLTIARTLARSATPFTLTISGLTLGTFYQVDSFLGASTVPYTEQVTAVGATTLIDAVPFDLAGVFYDVRHNLQPDATGTIVMTYASPAGLGSILNGISVTSTAPPVIPEPGTALFGLALLSIALTRRTRK